MIETWERAKERNAPPSSHFLLGLPVGKTHSGAGALSLSCMEVGFWKREQGGENRKLEGQGEDILHTNLATSHIYFSGYNFFTRKVDKLDYKMLIRTITETSTTTTQMEVLC